MTLVDPLHLVQQAKRPLKHVFVLLLEGAVFGDLSYRGDLVVHGVHPLLEGQHPIVHFPVDLPLGGPHLLIENLDPLLVPTLELEDLFTLQQPGLDVGELLVLGDVRLDGNVVQSVLQHLDLAILAHSRPVEGLELVLDGLFNLLQGLLVPVRIGVEVLDPHHDWVVWTNPGLQQFLWRRWKLSAPHGECTKISVHVILPRYVLLLDLLYILDDLVEFIDSRAHRLLRVRAHDLVFELEQLLLDHL